MEKKREYAQPVLILLSVVLIAAGVAFKFLPRGEKAAASASSRAVSSAARASSGKAGVRASSAVPRPAVKKLRVPFINQESRFPTGCEIVSAAMLLRYYGFGTPIERLIDESLDQSPLAVKNGKRHGGDPYETFIGSPYNKNSYGCYAPVIQKMLEKALPGSYTAEDATGLSLPELCRKYIDRDIPVLIWVSIDMKPTSAVNEWINDRTGEDVVWMKGEHCVVLTGYDETSYIVNDPYKKAGAASYEKGIVKLRYAELMKQALAVVKTGGAG